MSSLKYLAVGLQTLSLVSGQGTQYGNNQRTLNRDTEEVEEAFFQPIDDIELLGPAFSRPETIPSTFAEGLDGPTPQRELEYYVRTIAARNDYITYREADFRSEEGQSFPYVVLSKQSTNGTLEAAPKLRVWLQAAIHGDEPAGDQALLSFLGALDANATYADYLLERMDILMLPRYNPDGVGYFQRVLATNFDPNRDSVRLNRQQTRDIKTLFNSWAPHISGDMHEFGATTTYGPEDDLVHSSDALFSAAKNLNIHPDIRQLSEELFAAQLGDDLESAGFRWEPYVTGGSADDEDLFRLNEAGSDARIGRNGIGLSQTVSFLFETRGIFLAEQEFQRRTACGLTMIKSLVDTAAANYDRVYDTMTSAIDDFVSSDADIVITDSPTIDQREYSFVNVSSVEIVRPIVEFASTTPTTANLTRLRPQAYLIPRAWADVAENLRVFGLEVEELEYGYQGHVEALNITSSTLASSRYEGAVLQTVETEPVEKEVSLPPGSFWISTAQKNIASAFVVLEPENIDSYVTFGIIPLSVADEYPIFRVLG